MVVSAVVSVVVSVVVLVFRSSGSVFPSRGSLCVLGPGASLLCCLSLRFNETILDGSVIRVSGLLASQNNLRMTYRQKKAAAPLIQEA